VSNTTYYFANSNGIHDLFSFDVAVNKTVKLNIHQISDDDSVVSDVMISTDGVEIFEWQDSLTQSNTVPDEIYCVIENYQGIVRTNNTKNNSRFTINAQHEVADKYSEHTRAGRLLYYTEGVAAYWRNDANTYTIRQSNNNQYTDSETFNQGGALRIFGPQTTGDEIFVNGDIELYNGAQVEFNDTIDIYTTNQANNCAYITFETAPDTRYLFTCNAYYTNDPVYSKQIVKQQIRDCKIAIGNGPGDASIDQKSLKLDIDQAFQFEFTATQNTTTVSLGFGVLGNIIKASNATLKEYVPVDTYNQRKGTFFIRYTGNNTTETELLSFTNLTNNNNVITGNNSQVYINNNLIGSEGAENRVVYAYDLDANVAYGCINGGTIVTLNAQDHQLDIRAFECQNTSITEFSYVPILLSNTEIVDLTNE